MKKTILMCAVLALFACGENSSELDSFGKGSIASSSIAFSFDAESKSALSTAQPLEGFRIRPLINDDKLSLVASSETRGLVVVSDEGELLASDDDGESKSFDVLEAANGENHWLAYVDEASNRIRIRRLTGNNLSAVTWPQTWSSALTAVCLSHGSLSGSQRDDSLDSIAPFYLWSVTESGLAYQYLLELDHHQVRASLVRELALGEGVTHCAVDELSQRFYWSQEGVGVISLNADQEQDEERQLNVAVVPAGEHQQAPLDIQVVGQDQLLLTFGEYIELLSVPTDEGAASIERFSLNGTFSSVVLSPNLSSSDRLTLWGMQEEGDRVIPAHQALPHRLINAREPVAVERTFVVMPTAETDVVDSHGDAADDPEIWVNQQNPSRSVILSTDKQQGLWVHDLQGKSQQFLSRGRLNNVDLRYQALTIGDGVRIDVAIATNRSTNNVDLYSIDAVSGHVSLLSEKLIDDSLGEPYGACLYSSALTGQTSLFVNNKEGLYQQWQLSSVGSQVTNWATKVREFRLQGQPEGCVADDESGVLYVGEEDHGVWRLAAEPDQPAELTLLDSLAAGNLVADVEGISLYQGLNGEGYLVVSSQGDNAYVLYDRRTNEYVGRFRVGINQHKGIDGSSETDGLAVTSANLGGEFSQGVMVVQDGRNRMPSERQNFKIVPWSSVASGLNQHRLVLH